jgi:hypothetical protein
MSSDKIQFYDMKYSEGVCPSPFAAIVKFALLRKVIPIKGNILSFLLTL